MVHEIIEFILNDDDDRVVNVWLLVVGRILSQRPW